MSLISEIPKAYFDRFIPRPRDGFSSANMRNTYIALASGDFLPCRATCSIIIESHDVGSNEAAAALYTGTGVTVTKNGTSQNYGTACIQAVVDATTDRRIDRATRTAIDMSDFTQLGIWIKCTAAASAIRYTIADGLGNESYWNITTFISADTWSQAFITLSSPDSNNGTDADLTDVVSYGYSGLDASTTYLFDEVTAFLNLMKVWIEASHVAEYFYPFGFKFDGGLTPLFTAPVGNPRMDLISINTDGVLTVTQGTPTATPGFNDIPATPSSSVTTYPLYAVYVPTTATKIVEYHYKDMFPGEAYIYADLRRIYS